MAEYIEREAVKKLICGFCNLCDGSTDVCEYRDIQVDAIPAADVRPVVRGKWEEHVPSENSRLKFPWHSCSRCGAVGNPLYKFCYECGAWMEDG